MNKNRFIKPFNAPLIIVAAFEMLENSQKTRAARYETSFSQDETLNSSHKTVNSSLETLNSSHEATED